MAQNMKLHINYLYSIKSIFQHFEKLMSLKQQNKNRLNAIAKLQNI